MKLTKRKGFNFFRSYFDVYNELENDADKVAFMDALLDRQFMGTKPEGLKGMAKFAYISQTNSIDTQVKGYEDKTKTRLDNTPYIRGETTPTEGGGITPTEQVEEKGKGKGKEKVEEEEQEQLKKIPVHGSEQIKPFNDLENLFIKTISKYFDQTKPELEEGVGRFCLALKRKNELEDFITQTKAYIDFKNESNQQVHGWNNYQRDWKDNDWVNKLSKNKKQESNPVHSNR